MVAECLTILKAMPTLKGIFDPANFVQCGQDTLEAWSLLKPCIKYMHIKDARKNGSVVPAGEGAGNVRAIVSDFLANGGRDFTIEPHLAVFDGLSALERKDEKSNVGDFVYESNEQAFAAAVSAFRKIAEEV